MNLVGAFDWFVVWLAEKAVLSFVLQRISRPYRENSAGQFSSKERYHPMVPLTSHMILDGLEKSGKGGNIAKFFLTWTEIPHTLGACTSVPVFAVWLCGVHSVGLGGSHSFSQYIRTTYHIRCWLLLAMPAGVSWPRYLKIMSASLLAMFAGAEVVHRYYRPDLSIPEVPPKPGELRTELLGLKERSQRPQPSQ